MKKALLILGCVATVVAIAAGILVGTAKSRVIGTWEAEIGYLAAYDCEIVSIYEFREDGTFSQSFRSIETGGIQNVKYGSWSMSGLELHCKRPGNGGNTPFTFHPLSGTLTNGDIPYEKTN